MDKKNVRSMPDKSKERKPGPHHPIGARDRLCVEGVVIGLLRAEGIEPLRQVAEYSNYHQDERVGNVWPHTGQHNCEELDKHIGEQDKSGIGEHMPEKLFAAAQGGFGEDDVTRQNEAYGEGDDQGYDLGSYRSCDVDIVYDVCACTCQHQVE